MNKEHIQKFLHFFFGVHPLDTKGKCRFCRGYKGTFNFKVSFPVVKRNDEL